MIVVDFIAAAQLHIPGDPRADAIDRCSSPDRPARQYQNTFGHLAPRREPGRAFRCYVWGPHHFEVEGELGGRWGEVPAAANGY
jgi:hypothetical protein